VDEQEPKPIDEAAESADTGEEPLPAHVHTHGKHRSGEVIDQRYVLLQPIDEGGMGVVWRAHSLQLEIDVAIKFVQQYRESASATRRMAREARATASLTHAAVVRAFDFGQTSQGDPYLAMELLHGRTLGSFLDRKGPRSDLVAVQTLLPIADALAEAHAREVVHRDLKPDNIFLARVSGRTQPKLLDFSLVKLVRPGFNTTQTADQRGAGTVPYLAPEQATGSAELDARVDVWALCAVLYRTITGDDPFQGKSRYAVIKAVIEEQPTPTYKLGAGDRALWRIIERGLSKKPEERYAGMRELGEALADWLLRRGIYEDVSGMSLSRIWLDSSGTRSNRIFSPWRDAGWLRTIAAGCLGAVVGALVAIWLRTQPAADSNAHPAAPESSAAAPAESAASTQPRSD
jgi:serine/threonine protein kinase